MSEGNVSRRTPKTKVREQLLAVDEDTPGTILVWINKAGLLQVAGDMAPQQRYLAAGMIQAQAMQEIMELTEDAGV